MKKAIFSTLLIATTFSLVACSQQPPNDGSISEETSAKTQPISATPVGSWGTEDGELINVSGAPWIAVYKDGNIQASDGCFTAIGTWEKKGDAADIFVQGTTPAGGNDGCESTWIGKLDTIKVSETEALMFDIEGAEIGKASLVSRDPTLVQTALGNAAMNRGAEIAEKIQNSNIRDGEDISIKDDPEYQNRFG